MTDRQTHKNGIGPGYQHQEASSLALCCDVHHHVCILLHCLHHNSVFMTTPANNTVNSPNLKWSRLLNEAFKRSPSLGTSINIVGISSLSHVSTNMGPSHTLPGIF